MPQDAPDQAVPLHWLDVAASTQDSARALLADGARPPLAVATDDQRGGRGRLGRVWETPRGGGLALTLVHRPAVPAAQRTWYPLAAALGVLAAVGSWTAGTTSATEDVVALKWPNDVQDARGRKLAGILVEAAPDGSLLVGVGLNLRGPVVGVDGLPVPGAVALDQLGGGEGRPSRELAGELAHALRTELLRLDVASGDGAASGVADRYRESCITPGRRVRVETVGEVPDLVGQALGIDDLGRLLVRPDEGPTVPVAVGDVHHVRPAGPEGDPVDDRHAA